jgi:hypothetical protein
VADKPNEQAAIRVPIGGEFVVVVIQVSMWHQEDKNRPQNTPCTSSHLCIYLEALKLLIISHLSC